MSDGHLPQRRLKGCSVYYYYYHYNIISIFPPQYLSEYLSVGPPVYFVLKGKLDFSNLTAQNKVCGTVDCNIDSLSTQVYLASFLSNR